MISVKITSLTTAAAEPVTTAELKAHLRISSSAEDTLIAGFITSARLQAELYTSRRLMPQRIRAYYDNFPDCDYIKLPYPPLRRVLSTGVVYKGSTDNLTTFSSTKYDVDTLDEPGRIRLKWGCDWPTDTLSPTNPVYIDYVVGYASTSSTAPANSVPELIKIAIKQIAGHFYEHRESVNMFQWNYLDIKEIPNAAKSLLSNYRIFEGQF